MSEHYDTCILGVGAGAKHLIGNLPGRSVAVIERHLVGGECPYVACVPSKAMLRSAAVWQLGRGSEHAALFTGVTPAHEAYREACHRRDVIAHHRQDSAAAANVEGSGATLMRGTGHVVAPGLIDVGGRHVTYRQLIINTGSRPHRPAIEGIDTPGVWTSDQALSTGERPPRMVIVGGGAVGVELAFLFATFGTAVTLVHRGPRLVPGEEPEAASALHAVLSSAGVKVRLDEQPTSITPVGQAGQAELAVTLSSGSQVQASKMVLATGRTANGDGLGLERLGVQLEGTAVPVDDRCRVKGTQGVWAVGDATGLAPFTHTAHYQGRVVAANLNGLDTRASYLSIPRAVYASPALAAVGHTRATARAAGIETLEVSAQMTGTVRAPTDGSLDGWLLLLADANRGTLVGATALGGECQEWLPLVSTAIENAIPVDRLIDVVRPFPTFGEILEDCVWQLRSYLAERRA